MKLTNLITCLRIAMMKNNTNFLTDIISFKKFSKIKTDNDLGKINRKSDNLIDDYLFKRPWNKLHITQKRIKLNEFISNSLFNVSKENLDKIRQS